MDELEYARRVGAALSFSPFRARFAYSTWAARLSVVVILAMVVTKMVILAV